MLQIKGTEYDRGDLTREIADRTGINDINVGFVLDALAQVLPEALAEFGRVELDQIGTFKLKNRAADSGTLPDGTEWETPEGKRVVFLAWPTVKRKIAELTQKTVF